MNSHVSFSDADAPDYLDLGSLRIPLLEKMNIELDVEQETGQVVSVSISFDGSIISMQAFSAPTDEGAWATVRDSIVSELSNQHVVTTVVIGLFGTEIHCLMPTLDEHGAQVVQNIRFVGIDGPRWFLRCTIGGDGAQSSKQSAQVDEFLSTIEVIRGDLPMAPGELLPLEIPDSI